MKSQPNYYAIIPASVRYDKNLKASEKLLYGEITALAQKDGYCYASNSYFAKLYDVSTNSVSSWISALVRFGYIKSVIVYKEGSKEILYRALRLLGSPIQENLEDNNTSNNNTSNNNTSIIRNVASLDLPSHSELPLNIPKKKEENKKEESVNWEKLIEQFNSVTGKKTKVISEKAKKQILGLLRAGYSKEDFLKAIQNCHKDPYHVETNHKYLTLEFISRPDKMERFHFVKPEQRKPGEL
jgi:uncharacterized phage protein (TIGR02220 family)